MEELKNILIKLYEILFYVQKIHACLMTSKPSSHSAPFTPFKPITPFSSGSEFPILYINTREKKLLIKESPDKKVELIVSEPSQYHLFHHVVEMLQPMIILDRRKNQMSPQIHGLPFSFLQKFLELSYENCSSSTDIFGDSSGEMECKTHWIWGFIIEPDWKTPPLPQNPKNTFMSYRSKLRKPMKEKTKLGELFGKYHKGSIFIEFEYKYFKTSKGEEDGSYPVWEIFDLTEKAVNTANLSQRNDLLKKILQIDPDNWLANMLYVINKISFLDFDLSILRKTDKEELVKKIKEEFKKKGVTISKDYSLSYIGDDDSQLKISFKFIYGQLRHYKAAVQSIMEFHKVLKNEEEEKEFESALNAIAYRIVLMDVVSSVFPPPEDGIEEPLPDIPPWRSKEQLSNWALYLSDGPQKPSEEEITIIKSIQAFVVRKLSFWSKTNSVDIKQNFQGFVFDLSRWEEKRLPKSESAFTQRALDYVLANTLYLEDDDKFSAVTKVQNLRKLKSVTVQLRMVNREPSREDVLKRLQEKYNWSKDKADDVYALYEFIMMIKNSDTVENLRSEEP